MMNENKIKNVQLSMGRCVLSGHFFIGRFYEIFLDSHPDIKPKFVNTDVEKQKKLFKQGLNLAKMFANNDYVTNKAWIKKISEFHKKSEIDIEPHFYPYWKKSIIQAVSEHDREFSSELKNDWNEIL